MSPVPPGRPQPPPDTDPGEAHLAEGGGGGGRPCVPGHAHQALGHQRAESRRVPALHQSPALRPQAPHERGQRQHLAVAAAQQGAHGSAAGSARHRRGGQGRGLPRAQQDSALPPTRAARRGRGRGKEGEGLGEPGGGWAGDPGGVGSGAGSARRRRSWKVKWRDGQRGPGRLRPRIHWEPRPGPYRGSGRTPGSGPRFPARAPLWLPGCRDPSEGPSGEGRIGLGSGVTRGRGRDVGALGTGASGDLFAAFSAGPDPETQGCPQVRTRGVRLRAPRMPGVKGRTEARRCGWRLTRGHSSAPWTGTRGLPERLPATLPRD